MVPLDCICIDDQSQTVLTHATNLNIDYLSFLLLISLAASFAAPFASIDGEGVAVGFFPIPSMKSATGIKVAISATAMKVGFEKRGKEVSADILSAHTELGESLVTGASMGNVGRVQTL